MQRLEVSGAVRPIYGSLGVKRLIRNMQPVTLNILHTLFLTENWPFLIDWRLTDEWKTLQASFAQLATPEMFFTKSASGENISKGPTHIKKGSYSLSWCQPEWLWPCLLGHVLGTWCMWRAAKPATGRWFPECAEHLQRVRHTKYPELTVIYASYIVTAPTLHASVRKHFI